MTDVYFTINGHHTGQRWLINMHEHGTTVIDPRFWGVRDTTGLWYTSGAGRRFYGKWLPLLMLRIRFWIWRNEQRWKRRDRHQQAVRNLAAKHGGEPTKENL